MKTIEEQFIDWEAEVFGYGYGSGEEYILKALKEFFDTIEIVKKYNGEILNAEDIIYSTVHPAELHYDYTKLESKLTPTVAWLLINTLCHERMLDYGTSSRFGWLTEKGKFMYDFLKEKTMNNLYDLINKGKDNNYIICGKKYCSCDNKIEGKGCLNNKFFTLDK